MIYSYKICFQAYVMLYKHVMTYYHWISVFTVSSYRQFVTHLNLAGKYICRLICLGKIAASAKSLFPNITSQHV
jgi:hypothetical protein